MYRTLKGYRTSDCVGSAVAARPHVDLLELHSPRGADIGVGRWYISILPRTSFRNIMILVVCLDNHGERLPI